mmetsp:Transcript_31249/g.71346  ORF Transcript_31249/g.71346 Transcript_31249/m.71346 type:complete len:353 (-) Transcript_31249:27-1085(-)
MVAAVKRPASSSLASPRLKKQRANEAKEGDKKPMSIPTPARGRSQPGLPAAALSLSDGIRLANGTIMPVVGFGTYKLKDGDVGGPLKAALKAGYRLIDTAQVYDNDKGIAAAIKDSGIQRSDIFIQTKVWRSSHGYDRTMKAFKQTVKRLGVEYLDLYLIHWPGPKTGWPLPRGQTCPPEWTPALRNTGTWAAMEELYEKGLVKAIGVSNYSIRHLKELLKSCRVKPMVNQVEFHPHLVQQELLDFCRKEGIAMQAYGSLGSTDAQRASDFFALPPVHAAAAAHGVTPAQVLLRWSLDKGCMVLPKSTKPERIAKNADVFGFHLTSKEIKAIDALSEGTRYTWKGLDPDTVE